MVAYSVGVDKNMYADYIFHPGLCYALPDKEESPNHRYMYLFFVATATVAVSHLSLWWLTICLHKPWALRG